MADQQVAPQNPPPKGDKYAIKDVEQYSDGPIFKRSCTDIICWLIFVTGIVWWITAFIYGLSNGNPSKVFSAWDEDSLQCGHSTGYTDTGYAYFYTAIDATYISDVYKRVVCVKSCPTYTTDPSVLNLSTFKTLGITCKDSAVTTAFSDTTIIPGYSNPTVIGCTNFKAYKSFAFLGVYCLPQATWVTNAASELSGVVSKLDEAFAVLDTVFKWIDDLAIVWPVVAGGFGCAIFIGIVYCYFLRCCAALITWLIILLLMLTLWLGGALAYHSSQKYQTDIDNAN